MFIKIVNGTYGHREGKNIVPKTSSSLPFELDTEKAERLLRLKVAIEVNQDGQPIQQAPATSPQEAIPTPVSGQDDQGPEDTSQQDGDPHDDETEEVPGDLPTYSMANSRDELLQVADSVGVDVPPNATKTEIITLLDDKLNPAEEISGEQPPQFDATDPVTV